MRHRVPTRDSFDDHGGRGYVPRMKVLWRRATLPLGLLACTAACFGEDPAQVGPSDDGSIAGSAIRFGDLEATGCAGWETNEATPTLDPEKHGGKYSCRVCASGDTSVWGIFQKMPKLAPGGYLARAFARPAGDAGPFKVVLRLEVLDSAGELSGEQRDGTATVVPGVDGWSEVTTEISVTEGRGAAIGVFSSTPGGCFLIDDVTVVKKP